MLDRLDRGLLALMQTDTRLTTQEMSQRLNLSPSQIGRRRQRLEEEGYIRSFRAHLEPERIGLTVEAFIQISMAAHTAENARDFQRLAKGRAEVVGAWTLTGEADYLLRVFAEDLPALNHLVQEVLLPHPAVARVQSQIVMSRIKADAPLPL